MASREIARDLVINAMTVDVEDYFHVSAFDGVVSRREWPHLESRVVQNTDRILALFDETSVRATFFVLALVAERFPALVRRIVDGGHEIASHGYAHRLVYDQTPRAFRDDVRRAKLTLEQACGTRVVGFRAPSYSITPRSLWALDILIEEGYEYDASIFPIRHDRYGIAVSARHPYRITRECGSILEVPGSTVRVLGMNLPVAGGGYFRLLPYTWTKRGIERLNVREGRPAVFYIHPWELDPGQPKLPCSALTAIRHYRNLESTEERLRRLVSDFRFGPMAVTMADARSAPVPAVPTALALPYLW